MPNIDENEVLRDALSGLNEDVPPMPEGLHAAWMQKVEDDMENTRTDKLRTRRTITRWLSVAAAMVFVVGGTLLTRDDLQLNTAPAAAQSNAKTRAVYTAGAARTNSTAEYADEAYDTAAPEAGLMLTSMASDTGSGAAYDAVPAAVPEEKKIIRTASMTIATQTYEDSLNALKAACEGCSGWIESASENTNSYSGLRTAYLTLRVPQASLDAYLEGTAALGRITSRSESATDVTESYQDTRTRLNTQLALMDRLQALITESGDLSDLLALESQIADTQYEIDRLQSTLNRTDRQVSYATVNITLREEQTAPLTDTRVTFGDRLLSAVEVGFQSFVEFLGDMVIFLVAAAPFLLIVALVLLVVHLVRKARRKK